MRKTLSLAALALALAIASLPAQTPVPVVTPATAPAAAPVVQPGPTDNAAAQAGLKLLQEMKAANDETLKKQEAVLLQLEELQKAADQIKIYTKRG